MTNHKRDDGIIERIRRIYEDYQETIMSELEDDPEADEAELIHELALSDYNWNKIMQLYETDPAKFMETYGGINLMEDIDILVDWILFEK